MLDPRWKIRPALEEPLVVHTKLSRAERKRRVHETLEAVGLPLAHLDLDPHEISGGQQRRVGLARHDAAPEPDHPGRADLRQAARSRTDG